MALAMFFLFLYKAKEIGLLSILAPKRHSCMFSYSIQHAPKQNNLSVFV